MGIYSGCCGEGARYIRKKIKNPKLKDKTYEWLLTLGGADVREARRIYYCPWCGKELPREFNHYAN